MHQNSAVGHVREKVAPRQRTNVGDGAVLQLLLRVSLFNATNIILNDDVGGRTLCELRLQFFQLCFLRRYQLSIDIRLYNGGDCVRL